MKDIFVLVPTLNPNVELLEEFLKNLKKEFKNILLFDDGCRKEYDAFFKKCEKDGIVVLHHYKNLGKGRALKDAFNYILIKYPKIKGVVTADSDGQHVTEDILSCASLVLENPNNLILGCRDFDSKNVPMRNKIGNKLTRNVFKLFVGLKITDTQTGLRGFSRKMMEEFLDTKGERFEYENNMLIDTLKKEIEIKEFPIKTVYLKDSNKESHFNPIKDSIAVYKTFFKYIFASTSSFVLDVLLFTIFNKIFLGTRVFLATVFARCISAPYNYLLNSKWIFSSKNKTSGLKYIGLATVQMLITGAFTDLFDLILPWNTTIIKICIEIVIYIVNFYIQREYVFKGEKNEK